MSPSPETPAETEFSDEVERDYPLRSIGKLMIANLRGPVTVTGWAQDKIRVRARRLVRAETEAKAKGLLEVVDFRFREIDGDIELSAEYGRSLGIQARLVERSRARTSMEMEVFAPNGLALRILGVEGALHLKNWNASAELRTATGEIRAESVRGGVVLACPACAVHARAIRGPLRCLAGSGSIDAEDVTGGPVYFETTSGPIAARRISGEQLFVTGAGSISGRELEGRVEFASQQGTVTIADASGFLSGRSSSGEISASMRSWSFADEALIESSSGDIKIVLPAAFSGDVDFRSGAGPVECAFSVVKLGEGRAQAADPPEHRVGSIGGGGDLLKITSTKGRVQVLRGG
jgi:hypothetical protein